MMFCDQSAISAHYDTAHAQSSRPEHPNARHECEICGRKFTEKWNLKLHLRTVHGVGGAESFQCDVCSYVTKRKADLKRHLSSVHGFGDAMTFQCDVCSYATKRKDHLKSHLLRVHGFGYVETAH